MIVPTTAHGNTFAKSERLVSRKLIDRVFARGQRSVMAFPLRAVCLSVAPEEQPEAVSVLVSVSKRHFKHAVDRNRAKRQVREAYRLHKSELLSALGQGQRLAVAFLWVADEPQSSQRVARSVCTILHRLARQAASQSTIAEP